jgi:hypothetical protein
LGTRKKKERKGRKKGTVEWNRTEKINLLMIKIIISLII